MAQIYINDISVNNGLSLHGQTPLDDRLVWEGFGSIFINATTPKSCPLYGQAYKGMEIILFDEDADGEHCYRMTLKDATPYICGLERTVNASNYLNYWRQDTVEYELLKKFEASSDITNSDKVVGYYGDATGLTASELEQMNISDVLSKVLFEYCAPSEVTPPGLKINFKSGNAFLGTVEVGSAMPTATDLQNTFTQDVWHWVSSHNASVYGVNQVLCDNGQTVTYYLRKSGSDTQLPVTTKVAEGDYTVNGQIVAKKPYSRTGNAKDSRGSERNPSTGAYYHQGAQGTAVSNLLNITGGWKAYANAPKSYTSLQTAWNARNTEPGAMPSDINTRKVKTSYNMSDASYQFYLQWPSATTDAQLFYVWVPATYSITAVNAANNTTPAYDIAVTYTLTGTVTVTNDQGATGTFKLYSLGKSAGITNVQVTMTK